MMLISISVLSAFCNAISINYTTPLVSSSSPSESASGPNHVIPFTVQKDFAVAQVFGAGGNAAPAEKYNKTKSFVNAGQAASTLTAVVQVGTPPQPMTILFDTGSTLFWIKSSICNTTSCKGFTNYNHSLSTTYTPSSSIVTTGASYGDGSNVTCRVSGTDYVAIGNTVIRNQKLCEAFDVYDAGGLPIQGIAGISPPNYKGEVSADFMGTMVKNQELNENVMALWFNTDESASIAGELQFGGIDPDKYTGNITYYNITTVRDYWRLNLDDIVYEDNSTMGFKGPVVIDSGTTQVLLPGPIAAALNVHIGAMTMVQGLYTIDCQQILSAPPIKFYFAGSPNPVILQGRELVYHQPGGNGYRSLCISIFQTSQVVMNGVPVSIIGVWFLRNFLTVFNYDNATIGFGKPMGKPDPTAPFGSALGSSFPVHALTALFISFYLFV